MELTSQTTDLGTRLRLAREAKGLSLDEISNITRVRTGVLEALEQNDWKSLPEPIYVRSFLQAYANAVGLPAEGLFEQLKTPSGAVGSASVTVEKPAKAPVIGRKSNLFGWIVAIAAALALGAYIYFGLRGQTPGLFAAPTPDSTTEIATAPTVTTPSEAETSPPATNIPTTSVPTTQTPTASGEPLSVTLSVISTPPGASVALDGIRLGTTPLERAPVTAGANRELRVELAGRQSIIQTIDLSTPRAFAVTLAPQAKPSSAPAAGPIVLTFKGSSWMRITDANGKKLFEGTPAAGSSKSFA